MSLLKRLSRTPLRFKSLISEWARIALFIPMERLLPTRENYWCFSTWHGSYAHTQDNLRAVFEEVKDDPAIVKIILQRREQLRDSTTIEGVNVIAVNIESMAGAWYVARSRLIMIGYSVAGLCSYQRYISDKHRIVQLWHGIPLKRIGKLFPGESMWDAETPRYAAAVCSSERDREIMAAAFDPIPPERVWLTGLPRNSLFLKNELLLPADYKAQLQQLRQRLSGRRFILYAPTWRQENSGIYPFNDAELERLQALLRKQNAALGIRAHSNRRLDARSDDSSAIFYVNDFPDVNVLLRLTAVLITDYSSIYIDFLLTQRPILLFTHDLQEYVQERGFLYDLEEAMPAPWFEDFDELLEVLGQALTSGKIDEARYERTKALFHTHRGNCAAEAAQQLRQLARQF